MTLWFWIALVAALLAIGFGWLQSSSIMKADAGNDRMKEIAGAIQEGANAYLKRQYTTIAYVGVGVVVLLAVLFLNWEVPLCFIIGAVLILYFAIFKSTGTGLASALDPPLPMLDFAEEPPELQMLIDKVLAYNLRQAAIRLDELGEPPQLVSFGDDLGMQDSLPGTCLRIMMGSPEQNSQIVLWRV